MTADARFIAFDSISSNLDPADNTFVDDIYLRDRFPAGFSQFCDPGSSGVISCPCANPPASAGHGCDNSSSTGGATLLAAGNAYLSLDTIALQTSGERPSATSILLQGGDAIPGGVLFGQGVRCVGGLLKRLYVKTASWGAIVVPDFAAGDPSISARSASLGDLILAGQSRYYLVYYRDSNVLGGCPAQNTFNTTVSGRIHWQP